MSLVLLVFIEKHLIASFSIEKNDFWRKIFFATFGPILATPGVPHFFGLGYEFRKSPR